jgi:transcriptional regulator with XRE-family HTH domain
MRRQKHTNGTNGNPEPFGGRLAEIRKARGFSQRDLSAELGISQRMIAYYESQSERPPAHLLPKIAAILRVSADQILGIRPLKEKEAVKHLRLWRKLRQVETLRPGDRRALLKMLDALLAQQKR